MSGLYIYKMSCFLHLLCFE